MRTVPGNPAYEFDLPNGDVLRLTGSDGGEAARWIEGMRNDLWQARKERDDAIDTLRLAGFRRCDIAACNCGSWHGGHARDRLHEIREALTEAGFEVNGPPILARVKELIAERDALRGEAACAKSFHDVAVQQRNSAWADAERLRADAERYRWLRDGENGANGRIWRGRYIPADDIGARTLLRFQYWCDDVDAAIDAAREQSNG